MTGHGVTYVLIAEVPADGVDVFREYESLVLPLLAAHGGRLDRRLRSGDGHREIHIVWFPDSEALDAFRADPRRQQVGHLLELSRASTDLFVVEEVAD
jgi:uncharacterized protein (DUF1330 family)